MGSAAIPEGLVKKEVMIIGVLIGLIVGFLSGVIFSSFKSPQQPTPIAKSQPPQQASGNQRQAGPTPAQDAQISSLEKEVTANPKNIGGWTQLGNLYFDTDQPVKSIAAYKKSLELNQVQPDVWTDLGVMYRKVGQFKDAIAAFEQAMRINPKLEQALFNKGIVLLYDLNDKAGAIQAWQQEVDNNPNAVAPNGKTIKELIESVK